VSLVALRLFARHSGAGRNPVTVSLGFGDEAQVLLRSSRIATTQRYIPWIPACAGMTK
jgi:hypothetical protein